MPGSSNETARRVAMLREMARIRAFEREAVAAMRSGEAPGVVHPSIGQEAVAVGVCANLRRADRITSTHRGHGHALAKGADARAMMLELHGRAGGSCGGKGGSMHIADFAVGMLGANGVVGAGIPIACGAAQAIRLKGEDAIVACFFGDGAVNRGPFLEGMNWAALYRLPLLFVCEDNGFAAFTRGAAVTAGGGPAVRAEACGVPATAADGEDVLAVDAVASELVARIRGGAGPQFLHAKCYRWEGHTGTDAAAYRPAEEAAAARDRDCIRRLAALLDADEVAAIEAEAAAEMATHRAAAMAAPWPGAEAAFSDVQDAGAPA
ncbi:thiamine pyrophosphate-dependent dehydrogenase E1 component subunit alpha [Roseomonas sp. HJA6]|uniref:Thiamine pyrophosphate-dependent dehydrogenase E1 component subunit alpha n=1 Tax=Roseomonas alba TaxID=2846776 RepID=A0ABS7A5X7_9PROT|nr:thiamine pyrophosphate-dependent dehydrogenase E1 component subunit alpha [Neoroseomonas alba]MBW6397709.1 thiamine pyrophosphate-dependent dehydrogenase E1 component subunit alpha [Neoroseomonas alba]